jgi:hypothetical protein
MITNKGKNIIAKYLIGDAPAYASYIALGCGPKPRPNINEKNGVSLATITGIVTQGEQGAVGSPLYPLFIAEIDQISSTTVGLVPGMNLKLEDAPGSASLGENSKIVSIDGINKITVSSTTANSGGTVVFSTSGIASILSVSNTEGLWIGAGVSNSQFPIEEDIVVTGVNRLQNRFTITPGPVDEITFPTSLTIQTNPKKEALDFEMFRVPISSRGYVNDNGVNKIVLTAQLPTEERYEITEVGIYSSGSNSLARRYDSKVITAFSANENWQLVVKQEPVGQTSPAIAIQPIPEYQDSLIPINNRINKTDPAIKTSTTNSLFLESGRVAIYEKPRFLGNVIMLKSDSSKIFTNMFDEASVLNAQGSSSYIQINGKTIDLSQNSTSDLLKVAFSIISIDNDLSAVPDFANIIVEFSNSANTQIARLEINADNNILDFVNNRYVVSEKRLEDISYEGDSFSWRDVSVIRVYASATDRIEITSKIINNGVATLSTGSIDHKLEVGDFVSIFGSDDVNGLKGYKKVIAKTNSVSNNTFSFATTEPNLSVVTDVDDSFVDTIDKNFYICLDAIRLDNISTANPLYGLTGYSVVQNADKLTIVKSPNTNNYLEYRFVLDVL